MSLPGDGARLRAAAAAALLFVSGAVTGVLSDRVLLRPSRHEASPLTMDAMVDRLGLSDEDAERVRVLLDSLHTEIAGVLLQDPDSLRGHVRQIRGRIESALPESARSEFGEWILEHHRSMMDGGHGAPLGP